MSGGNARRLCQGALGGCMEADRAVLPGDSHPYCVRKAELAEVQLLRLIKL